MYKIPKNIVINGNEVFDFVNEVLKSSSLEDIEFRNCDFTNEDIMKLSIFKEYNRIAFIDCTFENENIISSIKTRSLSLTNNEINDYSFIYEMNELTNLTVVGGNIDISKINYLSNIEYLRLSHSNIINIEEINLPKLNYLFIDNTNIMDLTFIKNINTLKLLSISENQYNINKELIKIKQDEIDIIFDSIVEMEVSHND